MPEKLADENDEARDSPVEHAGGKKETVHVKKEPLATPVSHTEQICLEISTVHSLPFNNQILIHMNY